MNTAEFNILDLIPQRPPMVMIDKLVYADEKKAKGILFIKESNIFCKNGFLQEPGLVECIAQTSAAHTGFFQMTQNKKVSKGYIGAIKNLIIHSLPAVNTEIQSEVVIDSEILGFIIIIGKMFQNEKVVAECELRIILDDNIGKM